MTATPPPQAPRTAGTDGPTLPSIPVRGPSPCVANRCSACCHDTEMLLTEADLQRLAPVASALVAQGHARDAAFAFTADDGFLQLATRDAPPVAGHVGRPCFFLAATGECLAYAARPEGCRLYPAVWDGARLGLDADTCPHTRGFAPEAGTRTALASLADRLHAERAHRASSPGGVPPSASRSAATQPPATG